MRLCGPRLLQLATEEIANRACDFLSMRLQREMTCVVEAHLCVRIVSLERFSTRRQKKGIVLAPRREQRWLLGAEIFLELGVERDVAGIVQEQIKLDLVIAGPRQESRIQFVRLRRQERRVLHSMGVLPLSRFRLEE